MISVPHVSDLGDRFANHFTKVARSHNVTASAMSYVGRAITGFENILDREFNIIRVLFHAE